MAFAAVLLSTLIGIAVGIVTFSADDASLLQSAGVGYASAMVAALSCFSVIFFGANRDPAFDEG